jgi:DNA-binding PadR family transcriptional regulator
LQQFVYYGVSAYYEVMKGQHEAATLGPIEETDDTDVFGHLVSEQQPETDSAVEDLVRETAQQLFGAHLEQLTLDDQQIKDSLEELLIAFVVVSETDTHGKKLMNDLSNAFGTNISPGTLYPELHGLNEDDVFEQYELVRRKVYEVGDERAARDRLVESVQAHFLIAQVLYAALQDLESA